jgi:hypothetical protein
MSGMFKKKWVWIVVLFLVVNVLGIFEIRSLVKNQQGIFSKMGDQISQLFSFEQKKPKPKVEEEKEFIVDYVRPSMDTDNPYIYVRFTEDVDLEKAKSYIDIKPEIAFHIEDAYSGIRINADFAPGQTYALEILKNMPSSQEGRILEKAFKQEVTAPDYDQDVEFKVPGIYMPLKGNKTIPVEVMNLEKIEVKVHKVYENNIVYLLNNMSSYRIPSDLGLDVFEEEIETNYKKNVAKDVLINLDDILEGDSQGLFFMKVNNPDSYWDSDSKLVLTTDIGIVAKKSKSGLLVWLNSISDTMPIENATVKVFTKTNQQILQGQTGQDGVVYFKDVDWEGDKEPYVVTASSQKDLSFIELDKCLLSETAFDIGGHSYISSGYQGFVYTDRGVYRPQETVNLKAILREKGWQVPDSFPLVFEIISPDEKVFDKLNGILSSYGSLGLSFTIPDYALTGNYTVNLKLPGQDQIIGSTSFNVEEFMPDRLRVKVDALDKRYKVSDEIKVDVFGEQFFGAPAADSDVSLNYSLKPVEFRQDKFKDYSFVLPDQSFSQKTISLGQKKTDQRGKANFVIKLPEGLLPPSSLECLIQATVKETGGRAVTSSLLRQIDPYPYYLGIKKGFEGYASSGEPIKFDYVIVSPDKDKILPSQLEVEVVKVTWSSVLKKDKQGRYRYISEEHKEPVFKDSIDVAGNKGSYQYTPKSYGSYIIKLKAKGQKMHTTGVEFYCSGYGYYPWAKEKPDKVELSLDKPVYKSGDTAKLLVKAPFKGKALITISKEGILSTKAVELTEVTQEVPIEIKEGFAPNAYCSVTVIRPLTASDEWVAHRAYGIIPVMLDNSSEKLELDFSLPDKVKPGDNLEIEISAKDSLGNNRQAELSIALVDEGILQLTGFSTPDPFKYFYGKRANSINTYDIYSLLLPEFEQEKIGSDSSPSADKSKRPDFDPKKHLNPISAKRLESVSLWKGSLVTGQDGKAKASFKIPEFNGSLRLMVVASSAKTFGQKDSEVKVAEPLMVLPTLPRFLAMDDQFILPVTVYNKTGQSGKASLEIITSEGFTIEGKRELEINLDNDKNKQVSFKLKAPSIPGKAKITIKAKLGKFSSAKSVQLPVRPPLAYQTKMGSGKLDAPGKKYIDIPGNWLRSTANYSLAVMPYPSLKFAGGLKYLVNYPYGCIEQTTSSVYPLLYLKDIAAIVDSKNYSPTMIDSYIEEGIKRVLAMQTYSGGFAMWPGYQKSYKWGSIYATDFLVEADKAGYSVPEKRKDKALNYLKKLLSKDSKEVSLDLKTYAAFVLAKSGRLKQSWVRRLQEEKDKLLSSSRFYLAASLSFLGDSEAVADILGKGIKNNQVKRDSGGFLRSYVKENAIALSVYLDIAPGHRMVPILVKRLEKSMQNGNWGTTQNNAQALLALGKYARQLTTQTADYSGSISVGKNMIADFDDQTEAKLEAIDLGGKEVAIDIQGEGRAYYWWSAEGVPASGRQKEVDSGIKVRRTLFKKDGTKLAVNTIKQGDIVIVGIEIDAEFAYQNLIVEDLLPACFEIENPRLASTEFVGWLEDDAFEPDHIDIRDDRLLLFTDLDKTGNNQFYYAARAVTKGDFVLPAITASCMYDPTIKSINGRGRVSVGE